MLQKRHKQAAAEGDCSKGQAEHLKGGNTRLVKPTGSRFHMVTGCKGFSFKNNPDI